MYAARPQRLRNARPQGKRVTGKFAELQPTNLNILLLVFIFLLLAISVILGILVRELLDRADLDKDTTHVCNTRQCVITAAAIASKMDTGANPCYDFAQFACGDYINRSVIPEGGHQVSARTQAEDENSQVMKDFLEENSWPSDPRYLTQMKDLYRSCMDEDRIQEIGYTPYLNSEFARDWPVLLSSWAPEQFNLTDLTAEYAAAYVFPLFRVDVRKNYLAPSEHSIHIEEPRLGIPKEYLSTGNKVDPLIRTYQQYLTNFAIELGAERWVAEVDASMVVNLEIALAKIMATEEEKRDYFSTYTQVLVEDFKGIYPMFDLRRIWQATVDKAGVSLEPQDVVINLASTYFDRLPGVLAKTENRVLQNFFGFRYAQQKVGQLTKNMRKLYSRLEKVMLGRKSRPPRWCQCVDVVGDVFTTGMSKQFMLRKTSDNSLLLAEVIRRVKDELMTRIDVTASQLWSTQSRLLAVEKLLAMGTKIGYPDVGFDDWSINKEYENYTVSPDNFYENLQISWDVAHAKAFRKLLQTPDRAEWTKPVFSTDAFYSLVENEIVIPEGAMQTPLYLNNMPDAVKFGSMGAFVGYLMAQGFDDIGIQFDKDGTLSTWCEETDRYALSRLLECWVYQYSSSAVENLQAKLNEARFRSTIAADLTALLISYQAYKTLPQASQDTFLLPGLHLTNDQLFFLSWAQTLCERQTDQSLVHQMVTQSRVPGKYRILGTLKNSAQFATVYKCKPSSPMYHEERCTVW